MRAEMPQEQKATSWSEPLRLLLHDHLHETLITFGVSCLNAVAFYMLLTYMPTYVHEELGFSQDTSTLATSVMLVVYIAAIFLMGGTCRTHSGVVGCSSPPASRSLCSRFRCSL